MTGRTILFPEPCHENWDQMRPEGRARFCESCAKPVHDLSNYTAEEAEQLLAGKDGPACLRATITAEGQVITRPSGLGHQLMALIVAPVIAATMISAAAANPSQGSIIGNVATRASSVNVTAYGVGVHRRGKVDASGVYHLDNLPPGVYRLVFSVPHAQTWAVENVHVSAGAISQRNTIDPKEPLIRSSPRVTAGLPAPMPNSTARTLAPVNVHSPATPSEP